MAVEATAAAKGLAVLPIVTLEKAAKGLAALPIVAIEEGRARTPLRAGTANRQMRPLSRSSWSVVRSRQKRLCIELNQRRFVAALATIPFKLPTWNVLSEAATKRHDADGTQSS